MGAIIKFKMNDNLVEYTIKMSRFQNVPDCSLRCFDHWILEFGYCLEFDYCDLEFLACIQRIKLLSCGWVTIYFDVTV